MSQYLELDVAKPPLPLALDEREEPSSASPRRVWEALYRQRFIFLAVFSAVMLLGLLYIFGSHKKYTSTMKLLVHNSRGAEVITAGRVQAPAAASEITEELLNSEQEVLQSQDVLDEVIDPGWNQ